MGHLPANLYEVDPVWYNYQTSGEGEPAQSYNQAGLFGAITNNPGGIPGARYDTGRHQRYIARHFEWVE